VAHALISGSKIFEFQLGTLAAFAISIVYFLADYFKPFCTCNARYYLRFRDIDRGSNPFVLRWNSPSQRSSSARYVIESDYLAGWRSARYAYTEEYLRLGEYLYHAILTNIKIEGSKPTPS
jgi:hypothetical protein